LIEESLSIGREMNDQRVVSLSLVVLGEATRELIGFVPEKRNAVIAKRISRGSKPK
jgi:hypothetical protein